MKDVFSATVKIINEKGLHARTAAMLVKIAEQNPDCEILIEKGNKKAMGDSILSLLSLGAVKGSNITIYAKGAGAEHSLNAIIELVKSGFTEKI